MDQSRQDHRATSPGRREPIPLTHDAIASQVTQSARAVPRASDPPSSTPCTPGSALASARGSSRTRRCTGVGVLKKICLGSPKMAPRPRDSSDPDRSRPCSHARLDLICLVQPHPCELVTLACDPRAVTNGVVQQSRAVYNGHTQSRRPCGLLAFTLVSAVTMWWSGTRSNCRPSAKRSARP